MGHLNDEHYRGAIGDLRAFQRPGLETLRRYVRGDLPLPPIARLAGFRPTEAGLGKATFAMPVTRWLEDGFGLYWGGVFALFADAPLMSALWTTVPARKSVSTSELHMSFVRPMSRKTSNMIGRAETVHSGSQVGLSMIQITDNEGRLLAFGNTRCLITDVPVDLDVEYPPPDLGPTEPADPYLRSPPEDGYFSLDQITNGDPVELMRQTTRGEKIPPVWRLAGYRLISAADGRSKGALPSSPWFSNGGPSIYGGLLAWAAELTMGTAIYSMLSPGDVFATLDMHIRFARPALVDSGDFTLEASVTHRGRLLRMSSCNVDNAEGKRVAMATSSALVVECGARELRKGRLPEEILAEAASTETPVQATPV